MGSDVVAALAGYAVGAMMGTIQTYWLMRRYRGKGGRDE